VAKIYNTLFWGDVPGNGYFDNWKEMANIYINKIMKQNFPDLWEGGYECQN